MWRRSFKEVKAKNSYFVLNTILGSSLFALRCLVILILVIGILSTEVGNHFSLILNESKFHLNVSKNLNKRRELTSGSFGRTSRRKTYIYIYLILNHVSWHFCIMTNRGGIMFLLQFDCLSVCVCFSVCLSVRL